MGFVTDFFSSIFDKGGGGAQPPTPTMPDYSGEMYAMMGMMQEMMGGVMENMMAQQAGIMDTMSSSTQQMMESAASQQEQMMLSMQANMPELPMPQRDPLIDWKETQDQLSQKAKADYHLDQLRRKNVMDTVLTSPLLDEESPTVGGSVLTGE